MRNRTSVEKHAKVRLLPPIHSHFFYLEGLCINFREKKYSKINNIFFNLYNYYLFDQNYFELNSDTASNIAITFCGGTSGSML